MTADDELGEHFVERGIDSVFDHAGQIETGQNWLCEYTGSGLQSESRRSQAGQHTCELNIL